MDKSQIIESILAERERQEQKWGTQHHPSFDQTLLNRIGGCGPERMSEEYEIPSEARAKFLCEESFRKNQGTWAHILVEEVSEVIGTCNQDKEVTKKELIQTAAVIFAWLEDLD